MIQLALLVECGHKQRVNDDVLRHLKSRNTRFPREAIFEAYLGLHPKSFLQYVCGIRTEYYNLSDKDMLAICFDFTFPSTIGIMLSLETKLLPCSVKLSRTSTRFLCRDFHRGLSPFCALPTPISLHRLGGLTPISTRLDHILSPLLSHLCILDSSSSSDARHLLFRMRRMASAETLKCSERTGVVNLSGCVWLRCRIPSIVSGDSFLRGFHASPFNFSRTVAFCACHAGLSVLVYMTSPSSSVTTVRVPCWPA